MDPADRKAEIERRLRTTFDPESLEVEDESHLHAGHAGARDGRGHFRVSIIAAAFEGLNPIQRHRAIYGTMGDLMQTDIHALSIEALASSEI
jgi:BolA protein